MTVLNFIKDRGITEVLHFTTSNGILGILSKKALLSSKRLEQEALLQYILKKNCSFRKDTAWLDYVNLSISKINHEFFRISSEKWHVGVEGIWWCVVSFKPEILAHEGVFFTTTNNIYTSNIRGEGEPSLSKLFEDEVRQYQTKKAYRNEDTPRNLPTCRQAEVLYPKMVSTDYLQKIYVMKGEHKDIIHGQLGIFPHKEVEVVVAPEIFRD